MSSNDSTVGVILAVQHRCEASLTDIPIPFTSNVWLFVQAEALTEAVQLACMAHEALMDESQGRVASAQSGVSAAAEWVETRMRAAEESTTWRLFRVGPTSAHVQETCSKSRMPVR